MESHLARQVLHSMPVSYNVLNNNCQTFCNRLIERIQLVTKSDELFAYQRTLHKEVFDKIAERRAIELVWHTLLHETENGKITPHSTSATPSTLDTAILLLIDALTMLVLYWSYWQLSGSIFSLLVLALALHSLYGSSGIFRHLRYIRQRDYGARDSAYIARLTDSVIKHFDDIDCIEEWVEEYIEERIGSERLRDRDDRLWRELMEGIPRELAKERSGDRFHQTSMRQQ